MVWFLGQLLSSTSTQQNKVGFLCWMWIKKCLLWVSGGDLGGFLWQKNVGPGAVKCDQCWTMNFKFVWLTYSPIRHDKTILHRRPSNPECPIDFDNNKLDRFLKIIPVFNSGTANICWCKNLLLILMEIKLPAKQEWLKQLMELNELWQILKLLKFILCDRFAFNWLLHFDLFVKNIHKTWVYLESLSVSDCMTNVLSKASIWNETN